MEPDDTGGDQGPSDRRTGLNIPPHDASALMWQSWVQVKKRKTGLLLLYSSPVWVISPAMVGHRNWCCQGVCVDHGFTYYGGSCMRCVYSLIGFPGIGRTLGSCATTVVKYGNVGSSVLV